MPKLDFEELKQDLDNLAMQVARRDSAKIQLQARLLAGGLEEYGEEPNPGSAMCREIAERLREVEISSQQPEIAVTYLKKAEAIFQASEFYPKFAPKHE